MQGGRQLPRSDQKKLDKVRRAREAMATGGPILNDIEKDKIAEYAKILGTGGVYHVEKLLARV
jgi:hypothetical protein